MFMFVHLVFKLHAENTDKTLDKCPQMRLQIKLMNNAAIALQLKSNVKLIAALFFISYNRLIKPYTI